MQNHAAVTFSFIAWAVAILRLASMIRRKAWRSDRGALRIWLAMLLFAVLITLLEDPVGEWIDASTLPNLSRFVAYIFVELTIYLFVSAFLANPALSRWSHHIYPFQILMWVTLGMLCGLYGFSISKVQGWQTIPTPVRPTEVFFQQIPFLFGAAGCGILVLIDFQLLRAEAVKMTRYRIVIVLLTAGSAGLYFLVKMVYSLGYFWPPLKSEVVRAGATTLESISILLWASSFLNNAVYARINALVRGIQEWPAYCDLRFLVESLDPVCPAVGLAFAPASFWMFIFRADYHLYQALLHILDCKVMLGKEDILEPESDLAALKSAIDCVNPGEDFQEMIAAYCRAARILKTGS